MSTEPKAILQIRTGTTDISRSQMYFARTLDTSNMTDDVRYRIDPRNRQERRKSASKKRRRTPDEPRKGIPNVFLERKATKGRK